MKKIALAVLISILMVGCGPTRPKGIKDCEFRLADVKTVEKALTYAKLQLNLDVTNPNGVEVIVDHMRFTVYANGHNVGSGAASFQNEPIPPGESVKFKAKVSIDYIDAGVALFSMIKAGSVSYHLGAKVYYETPLGAYAASTTISEAHLPSFYPED